MDVTAPALAVTQATHEASIRSGSSAKSVSGATHPSMFKFLFTLAIGIVFGYSYGWNDAQRHEKAVYERAIDRIGGDHRDRMENDVDARTATTDGR